ncbi:hypothetical protein DR92_4430 (plasmid) [Brucella anthropi]|nr:hypothetical protein DR92_4430 [Brucella anthropi]
MAIRLVSDRHGQSLFSNVPVSATENAEEPRRFLCYPLMNGAPVGTSIEPPFQRGSSPALGILNRSR